MVKIITYEIYLVKFVRLSWTNTFLLSLLITNDFTKEIQWFLEITELIISPFAQKLSHLVFSSVSQ